MMTRTRRLPLLAAVATAATAAVLTLTAVPAHADSADVSCQSGVLDGSTLTATGCHMVTDLNINNITLTATFDVQLPLLNVLVGR